MNRGGSRLFSIALSFIMLLLARVPEALAADVQGAWIPWRNETAAKGATFKEWDRKLQTVAGIIRKAPVFTDLSGYFPHLFGTAESPRGERSVWIAYIAFESWWPEAVERTARGEPLIKAKWEYNRPPGLWIGVNTLRDLREWHSWDDAQGRFYALPETKRDISGFPVVGDRLIITRPGKKSPFAPVGVERALRWVVNEIRRQAKVDEDRLATARREYERFTGPEGLAKRRKEIEAAAASQKKPENQALERKQAEARDRRREQDLQAALKPNAREEATARMLRDYEERLAGLSATERSQPAGLKQEPKPRGAPGEIVSPNTQGARPLVVLAKDFFDPALPPTAMQMITVPLDPFEHQVRGGSMKPQARVPLAIIEQTDWREVVKLLE